MDILKAFSLLGTDYQVQISGTYENPLFRASDIGNILEMKRLTAHITDLSSDEKAVLKSYTLGGNQDTIFLTELGLYKIIGRSRKPIAALFQKWVVNVIKEIRINGFYKLNQEKEIDKKLNENKNYLLVHNALLKAYDKCNIVYICKIKDLDETNFIIKVGSTQNIKERLANIARTYNTIEPLLLDIFPSNNNTKIENIIHKNDFIKEHRFNEIIKKDGFIARELYKIDKLLFEKFINIINDLVKQNHQTDGQRNYELEFQLQDKYIEVENKKIEAEDKRIELENILLKQKEIELEILKLKANNNLNLNEIKEEVSFTSNTKEETNDSLIQNNNVIIPSYIKKRNYSIKVPKVYQYSPDDLKNPIRIFDSPASVEREINNISQSALKRSIQKCSIYKDYRWYYVKRNEEPPKEIPQTKQLKNLTTEVRYVAMIDIKKTKIIEVFASHKDAIEARNMKCNSFTRAIKNQSLSSGHYWNYFDNCSEEMKNEYLKKYSLPHKKENLKSQKIQRIDPNTNKIISEHSSKREIIKLFQISNSKLNQLIKNKNNEVYKGFIWKLVE